MMQAILIKYWKPLAIIIIVVLCGLWGWHKVVSYGNERYEAGHAKAIADQKAADQKEEARRYAEKQKLQADAQQRVDAARRDAADAAASVNRLRSETDRIRKLAERYTGTQPAGVSTGKVVNLLAELLSESNDAYQRTAEEADRYYNAGLTCQRQYESLTVRSHDAE